MMNRKNCRYVIVPAMLAMLLTASLTGCGTKEGADSMSDADTTTVTDSVRDDDSKSGIKEDVEDMVTDAEDGVRDLVTDEQHQDRPDDQDCKGRQQPIRQRHCAASAVQWFFVVV